MSQLVLGGMAKGHELIQQLGFPPIYTLGTMYVDTVLEIYIALGQGLTEVTHSCTLREKLLLEMPTEGEARHNSLGDYSR